MNISSLARCIENEGEGVPQVVYYHTDIGSGTSRWANRVDDVTGRGEWPSRNCWIELIHRNYVPNQDGLKLICLISGSNAWGEIYLVGFSGRIYSAKRKYP